MICGSARLSILSVRRVFAKSKNLKVLLLSHFTFREVRQVENPLVSLLVRFFTMSGFAKSKNLKVLLLSHLTFREVRQT
jgi:Ran GTPase-activating protein (RanGAP) involved in mRNA processing and transport